MPDEITEPRRSRPPQAELPPHSPEDSRLRRLLGPLHVTGLLWYRLHVWAIRQLPSWSIGFFVFLFTTFFFLFLFKIRAAIAGNLAPVVGRCGWLTRQARIYRTMWQFAWCLTERYERLQTDRPFAVRVDGMDTWRAVAAPGVGFVLVTAHVGNYEVGSMLPADMEQRPVHVVREREVDPRAQQFLEGVVGRRFSTHYTMHFESDDPLQGLALLDALRRGEVVALQGDRPRAGGRVVDAALFGRPFPLPAGPATLARSAGAALLPAFVFREGRRRYRLVFRPPIVVERSADRAADIERATRRIAAEVEWAIREAPFQWFCFRRLWAS